MLRNKGISLYKRGFPFEFILMKMLNYGAKSPKKGITFIKGYFSAAKSNTPKVVTKNEMKFFRKLQYKRLLDKFTRKQLL